MNKVLSFIEWYMQDIDSCIGDTDSFIDRIDDIANFYNQPFDVSMLVNPIPDKDIKPENFENENVYAQCLDAYQQAEQKRLFEGWEFNKEEHPYDYEWNSKNVSVYMNNGNEYVISLDFTDHSMIIRTVNDLITFCNTEGIELTWNPNNQTIKNLNLN